MSTHSVDQPVEDAAVPSHAASDDGARKKKLIALAILGVLLLLVAIAFAWYLITRKPITAIPGLSNEAMPRYNYSIYGVSQPLGVAVSPDGDRIYVTQSGGDRTTLMFDHAGHLQATLKPPTVKGAMHIPVYVAINPTNNDVYVTDRASGAVYVYTQDGTYRREIKPGALKGTWQPLGLSFAADGTLYVTEVGGKTHRVLALDSSDKITAELTPADLPMLFPNGTAVDGDGRILVADSNNGRLVVMDPGGRIVGQVRRGSGEGDLGLPRGVATGDGGRIFVVDTTNQGVHVYRLGDKADDGTYHMTFVGAFGDEGIADGLFEYPNGIATDSRSDVYVTDRENGRVQVWSF